MKWKKWGSTYVWNEITDHNKYEYSNSNPWMYIFHSHFNLIIVSSCSCVHIYVNPISISKCVNIYNPIVDDTVADADVRYLLDYNMRIN